MLSRYFVILLATVLAVVRAKDRAWVEATGLASLALGLACLRLADTRQQPQLKKVAMALFAVTLIAMGIVFQRDYLR
jgi:hypothetical protein